MEQLFSELDRKVSASSVLGYLNFSDGRPDPRWQRHLHDAVAFLTERGQDRPWEALAQWLAGRLDRLHAGGGAAFRDITQARRAIDLFSQSLAAYRRFHSDLLAHLSDRELFQPFFLVRVFEAVLAQLASGEKEDDPVAEILKRLNDFVGYRPIALLETRPRGEPYEHERHRPIPLYLRGVGVAHGPYGELVEKTLDILRETDPGILHLAQFDLGWLEELALDARAYDHGHPVNRRPNYVFGEWDPHHLDSQGHYCRFVVRQVTLEALLSRVETAQLPRREALCEAAAVLAGTILMASGITGSSPTAHDSSASLANLMPGIARYRDEFYQHLLTRLPPAHADRLRAEAEKTRQPFGGARQHLNAYLARHRAAQMQHRFLALLFAEMGYPAESRAEAQKIPAVSVRLLSEVLSRISTGQREIEQGRLREAASMLPEIEGLLHRGIACGGFADPWNVLGFQALFPLSPAQEDSVRDVRLDELIHLIEQIFHFYARLSSEAAASGEKELVDRLLAGLRALATWWDRHATIEVSDVRRVHGEEALTSATSVARAMALWRERGEGAADLAFWREHLDKFRSPKAFALVVDALLRKSDHRAALALLVNWAGQAEQTPLEEGPYSFHSLALRWLLGVTGDATGKRDLPLARKFFDFLEANAEDYWQVPTLESEEPPAEEEEAELFEAAYEDVTWKDSADDEEESSLAGSGPTRSLEFNLEEESKHLEKRLRFLSAVARMWAVVARAVLGSRWSAGQEPPPDILALAPALAGWEASARQKEQALLELLDAIHSHEVPTPSGAYDAVVEYDRRRVLKDQLTYATVATCLDMTLAVGALRGAREVCDPAAAEGADDPAGPPWSREAIRLEQAFFQGDIPAVRSTLTEFLEKFRDEPLLFTPLSDGGQPRLVLRVRVAQTILRALLTNLPRLGLIRDTYDLLRTVRQMERRLVLSGRGVTEFNHLFQTSFLEVVESIVASSESWGETLTEVALHDMLERLVTPFLTLWIEHSRSVQLSVVETVTEEAEWARIKSFIRRYGRDLFQARFMTLGNLRGILHRGVEHYLEYLRENPDPLHPNRLMEELDEAISREDAVRRMQFVLQCVVENYEEYKDYNTTTAQSDYGENLYVLLDFLRLKAAYDRHAWQFRPLVLTHEALVRRGKRQATELWERSLTQLTGELGRQHLEKLAKLEQLHGVRLNTVADRVQERFVKPLALDRLRALIEPAMDEARAGGPTPSFVRFQEELRAYTATPTGVGLDVPSWLRLLESEVQRVQATRSTLAVMAENFYRIQRRMLSLDELYQQLRDWVRAEDQSEP